MFRFSAPVLAKLQPLGARVLVRRAAAETQTKAGIIIPQKAAQKMSEGVVVAVGAASKDWTPSVKEGDKVLLPEYGGSVVKIDGEELQLFMEESILGFYAQ